MSSVCLYLRNMSSIFPSCLYHFEDEYAFFKIYFAFFVITDFFFYIGLLLCYSLFLPHPPLSGIYLAYNTS